MARDGGSVVVDEDVLHKLQTELGQLTFGDPMIYQPLHEMIQDIVSWMEQRKNTLEKREFQHYFSCWSGDKALRELQEANITQQCFPILQDCATKAIKAASDTELGIAHLTGMSATTLEGLFSSLNYFFSGNGVHMYDYQLALQRYVKRDAGNAAGGWTNTLSLWCLNPAVVFRDIADLSLSVILTSGTLSPMNSFSSELGVQFGTCLEAPHVIDVESQLWAAVISTGPGNYPLNACYKTADGYAFQDALGKSLEEICKIVPGGSLIFFPSYKLMEKLCNRWRETEPRGGSQDDLEPVLMGYYNSIRRSKKPALGRRRRGKRLGLGNSGTMECTDNFREGAAFLAVCRGKVSEGIDFSDENARAVVSFSPLCRCIRHKFDYGAIILLDANINQVVSQSKLMQERVGKEAVNMVQISDVDVENISAMNQGKGFTGKKNQKVNKSNKSGLKLISNGMMAIEKTARFVTEDDVTSIKSKSEDNAEVQASSPTDVKHTSSSREYVDQEFSSRKDFRCVGSINVP
ncbi:DNA helicase [Sarracenia purpurea var. burkii]